MFISKLHTKYKIISKQIGSKWFHLTDKAKFKLDPNFTPEDNTIALEDRSGRKGIYLAEDVDKWLLGEGYWRPFLVEFHVDPSVVNDEGIHGRWGGEIFIPATSYSKLTIKRVIPIDAYAREQYGQYGWIEDAVKEEFDTGKPITSKPWEYPFRGYKYNGPDVREMSADEIKRIKSQFKKGVKLRTK
jgi:hypothetical protein